MRGATTSPTALFIPWSNFNPRAPCGARPFPAAADFAAVSNFNPRAPCGARLDNLALLKGVTRISIHAPHAGRDSGSDTYMTSLDISIHAPHAGRDPTHPRKPPTTWGFQSTRPMRGATSSTTVLPSTSMNFNPRAPCGARRAGSAAGQRRAISIHAPHAGRDVVATMPMAV